MKSLIASALLVTGTLSFAYPQVIPYGFSSDSVCVVIDSFPCEYNPYYRLYYYKPNEYDSITSPVIWYIHGINMSGSHAYTLQSYADRHNALLIGADMHNYWSYVRDFLFTEQYHLKIWLPVTFKQIYRHILMRENREEIPVYLTGFSAGGQCVTRYMLARQANIDSIPIVQSISVSPHSYTFPTEEYCGVTMKYIYGLSDDLNYGVNFNCAEHVIQYYNENYIVIVGNLDTVTGNPGYPPLEIQGNSRLSRARNFYAFCDSNAANRGTELQWGYAEIPGVGHDNAALYLYTEPGDSIPLIDRLMFETPYHEVPQVAPFASFTADNTSPELPGATVIFTNLSVNAVEYLWRFGDGDSSHTENPSHTYQYADTFHVELTAYNETGCSSRTFKYQYIIVKTGDSSSKIKKDNNLSVSIYPVPAKEEVNFSFVTESEGNVKIVLYDLYNRQVAELFNNRVEPQQEYSLNYDAKGLQSGVYYVVFDAWKDKQARKLIILR